MQRDILTRGIIAGVLIAIVFVGILYLPNMQQNQPIDGHTMRVELYVYKNGELVYYDPDDPAVNNLAYLLAELLDYDGAYNAPKGQRMDGSNTWGTIGVCGTSSKPILIDGTNYAYAESTRGFIIAGQDELFSRQDYTLSDILAKSFLDEFIINSTGTEITLTLGGSITYPSDATSNYTVTAVGLGITACDPGTSISNAASWLLFKDVLNIPVTLQPGDTIHVRYVIHLP